MKNLNLKVMPPFYPSKTLLYLIFLFLFSCKRNLEPAESEEVRDSRRLVQIIEDSLKGKGIGYSFIVSKKGVVVGSGVGGFQSRSVEYTGEKPVTLDTRMQIASMSKTITAVAFIMLARQKRISTADRIIDFLPAGWKAGPGVDRIIFKDLLTHRSGIVGLGEICQNGSYSENYWFGLKQLIAKGVKPENYGNSCYQNANFGLFRVLIPSMMGYKFTGVDMVDDQATQTMYLEYVRDNITSHAGINSPELLNNLVDSPTFGYDQPYEANTTGFNPGNFYATAGAYGFYLSAKEAIALYSTIFSSEDQSVLNTALKDSILSKGLGSYSALTPQGQFYYHDGLWYSNYGNGDYKGFRSIWMKGPDETVVVLFTNSLRHGDGLFPIKSNNYFDISSYLLWCFSEVYNPNRNARMESQVNYQIYLSDPKPH